MIVILAAKTKRRERKNAHLVGVVVEKRDQNTPHADLPPEHVVREAIGVRNQREARRDENHRNIHQASDKRRVSGST